LYSDELVAIFISFVFPSQKIMGGDFMICNTPDRNIDLKKEWWCLPIKKRETALYIDMWRRYWRESLS